MQSLHIDLKPSRYLFVLFMLLHGGAIVCIAMAELSYLWKLLAFLIIAISFMVCYHASRRWSHLSWENKVWKLSSPKQNITLLLCNDSIRTEALLILNFRSKVFPYFLSLIIFPDTMSKENFRRLSVLLLMDNRRIDEN